MNGKRYPRSLMAVASLAVAAVLLSSIATEAQPTQSADSVPPQPVVDTHHLMSLFNRPLYQRLKDEMQQQPADEKAWATLSDRGLQAAEVANLVAMRKDQQQWRRLAGDLQTAGVQLSKAAKSQDWQATQSAYRSVVQRCNACHSTVAPDHAPQLSP